MLACDACDICDVCDEAENDAYVPKTGAIIFMAILSTVNSDHIDYIHQIGVIILQSVWSPGTTHSLLHAL